MPAIGIVTKQKDGSFKGQLKTLTMSVPLLITKTSKTNDSQPDYRVSSNGVEIGAAWIKEKQDKTGNYVSVSLADPAFGKLYANLGKAAGQDDEDVFALIWNPRD